MASGGEGPFLRVFVNDWLDPASRINTLSSAQEAAYFRLGLFQFRDTEGLLPDAPPLLAYYARSDDFDRDVLPVLEMFFERRPDGRWSQPRVRQEWLRAHAKSNAAREAAKSRWQKGQDANAERVGSGGNAIADAEGEREGEREGETPPKPPSVEGGRRGLEVLVEDASRYSESQGLHCGRPEQKVLRAWFKKGKSMAEVKRRIDEEEHVQEPPL